MWLHILYGYVYRMCLPKQCEINGQTHVFAKYVGLPGGVHTNS